MPNVPGDHAYDVIYRATADFADLFAQVAAANAAIEELKKTAGDSNKSMADSSKAAAEAEKARSDAMRTATANAKDDYEAQLLLNRAINNGFNTPLEAKNFRDNIDRQSWLEYNKAKNNGRTTADQILQDTRNMTSALNDQNKSLASMRQTVSDSSRAWADAHSAEGAFSSGLSELVTKAEASSSAIDKMKNSAEDSSKSYADAHSAQGAFVSGLTDLFTKAQEVTKSIDGTGRAANDASTSYKDARTASSDLGSDFDNLRTKAATAAQEFKNTGSDLSDLRAHFSDSTGIMALFADTVRRAGDDAKATIDSLGQSAYSMDKQVKEAGASARLFAESGISDIVQKVKQLSDSVANGDGLPSIVKQLQDITKAKADLDKKFSDVQGVSEFSDAVHKGMDAVSADTIQGAAHIEDLAKKTEDAKKAADDSDKSWKNLWGTGDILAKSVSDLADKFSKLKDTLDSIGSGGGIGGALGKLGGAAAGGISSVLTSLSSGLSTVSVTAAAVAAAVPAAVTALAALGSAAMGLVGALAPLVGIVATFIPIMLGMAEAGIVLKAALGPVATAIKDLVSPTQSVVAAGQQILSKFSPAVQQGAHDIANFIKGFSGASDAAKGWANAIFTGINPALNQLNGAQKPVLDALNQMATAIGKFLQPVLENLISFLKGPAFQTMSGAAAQGLAIFGKTIADVLDTLEKLGAAASPYMVQLASLFEGLAKSVDGMVTTASKDGQLKAFFQQMITAFELVTKDVMAFLKVVGDLGQALAPLGNFLLRGIASGLDDIDKAVNKVDWTKWISNVEHFLSGLGTALSGLFGLIGSLVNSDFLKFLGDMLTDLGKILKALEPIGHFISVLVGGALKDMASIFNTITRVVVDLLTPVGKLFDIISRNKPVMETLSAMLAAIGTVVVSAKLIQFVTGIGSWVKATIQDVITLINKLPGVNLPGGGSGSASSEAGVEALNAASDKAATSLDAVAAAADKAASAMDAQAGAADKAATADDTQAGAEDKAAASADTQAGAENKAATSADTQSGAENKAATSADTQSGAENKAATSADTQSGAENKAATSADTQSTAEGKAATSADTQATAEGKAATSADTQASSEGKAATAADTEATAEDRAATAADTEATAEDTAATAADTEATAEDAAATAADGSAVAGGAGGLGGLAGALSKVAAGLGIAAIGNQVVNDHTKPGSSARTAGTIGADTLGGAVAGTAIGGPIGGAVGGAIGLGAGILMAIKDAKGPVVTPQQAANSNANNIHLPTKVQGAGGETQVSSGDVNSKGQLDNQLSTFEQHISQAAKDAQTKFDQVAGSLFLKANPSIQASIVKPIGTAASNTKSAFDRIAGGLFGQAPSSVNTHINKPTAASAANARSVFDRIAGGLFGKTPPGIGTNITKPVANAAANARSVFDRIAGGLFGKTPSSVLSSVTKPVGTAASNVKSAFDRIAGGLFGKAPSSVTTHINKPTANAAADARSVFDRIAGGLFGKTPPGIDTNITKPIAKAADSVKSGFDRIAGGLFGKAPSSVDTHINKPTANAAADARSVFDRISGGLFGKVPSSVDTHINKPTTSAKDAVKSAFDTVSAALFGKVPSSVDAHIAKPTSGAKDSIKTAFDTLSSSLFGKVPSSVDAHINKPTTSAHDSIKSAFDTISSSLFGKVPSSVDAHINKPTTSSHDSIKSAFDTLSSALFAKAPGSLDTNVNKPIASSQSTSKKNWDSTIGTWFDKSPSTYSSKVDTPIHGSVTSTIPGYWNTTIPRWFDQVGPHFVSQVETPMGSYLTNSLPPSIQTSFKDGMNKATSNVINPAIDAVNAVVGVIPGINLTLKHVAALFAEGGHVGGNLGEPDNSDSVLTRLTPGEFVIRKKAAQKLGSATLDWLNHADKHLENGSRHDHPLDFNYPSIVHRAGGGLIPTPTLPTITTGQVAAIAQPSANGNTPSANSAVTPLTGKSGAANGIVLGALQQGFDNLWTKNVKPLLDAMGSKGIPAETIQGINANIKSNMDDYLKKQDAKFAAIGGNIPTGDRLAIIDAALQADGIAKGSWPTWEAGLNTLISRESAWDAGAVNNYDSNAAAGTPSEGLAQVIAPTFAAYRNPSLPDSLTNPIANVAAAINYINATYGGINNVQQANANLPPKGYAHGGQVAMATNPTLGMGFAAPGFATGGTVAAPPAIKSQGAMAANGGRSGPGLHIENVNISNPLPEQVGDSLQRMLNKTRVYGARH